MLQVLRFHGSLYACLGSWSGTYNQARPRHPFTQTRYSYETFAVIIVVIWRCRSNISLPSPELSILFSRSSESDYHGILGLVKPPRLLAWEHWRRAARGSRGRFRILP
ncbi:hypothetical protein IG631_15141 [Alternaria alternata]|nr:hypothetical protein IG631_15141 [Alternaria alternata]